MSSAVVTCALILKLSMTTKVEMARIFPGIASFCLSHAEGKVLVTYSFKSPNAAASRAAFATSGGKRLLRAADR